MHKPSKIISGGQTGADLGGLLAAYALGIATGGTAPKGYRSELTGEAAQRHASMLVQLGLVESPSRLWILRTVQNVADSDATVIFGWLDSPGSKRTWKECLRIDRQCIVVPYHSPERALDMGAAHTVRQWIHEKRIRVLNVAGNRESRKPGIQKYTQAVMTEVLS